MLAPFAEIPLLDHHCHSLLRAQPESARAFRACFTESHAPAVLDAHVPASIFYRRAIRDLAEFFHCRADEDAVLEAREATPFAIRAAALFADANIDVLLVDGGFQPERLLADDELAALLGRVVHPVLRLEHLAETLIPLAADWPDLAARFEAAVTYALAHGTVALKSIAAYRTGLRIETWEPAALAAAFDHVRDDADGKPVRLAAKPLIDALLARALAIAARDGVPLQLHTGFGDHDLDLLLANPLWLRPLLEDPAHAAVPFVLLHCHPYVDAAAWLAAIYPNVHVDLSLTAPHLAHGAADAIRDALAMAPATKVMLATDASRTPELFWVAATHLRRSLATAMDAIAAQGFVTTADREEIARLLLRGNAARVYGLEVPA